MKSNERKIVCDRDSVETERITRERLYAKVRYETKMEKERVGVKIA